MEKGDILGYRAIAPREIPGYNACYDYAIIGTNGGCMDDAASPMAIPDGAQVLGHWVSRKDFMRNWEQYQRRLICIYPNSCIFKDDKGLVKELVEVADGWFLVLRMYVPFKEFSVPVDCIKDEILIIDKVIDSDGNTR